MALVAFADPELKKNTFEITIPWLAGILSTRSLDKQIPGLNQIIAETKNCTLRVWSLLRLWNSSVRSPTMLRLRPRLRTPRKISVSVC